MQPRLPMQSRFSTTSEGHNASPGPANAGPTLQEATNAVPEEPYDESANAESKVAPNPPSFTYSSLSQALLPQRNAATYEDLWDWKIELLFALKPHLDMHAFLISSNSYLKLPLKTFAPFLTNCSPFSVSCQDAHPAAAPSM